jgi:hypothetical protein
MANMTRTEVLQIILSTNIAGYRTADEEAAQALFAAADAMTDMLYSGGSYNIPEEFQS